MADYMNQSDFAKNMSSLLYAENGGGCIAGWDPYWIDKNQNKAASAVVAVDPANPNNGLDASGTHIAYRLLKPGVPSLDLSQVTGMSSPNTENYRAQTAGTPGRATGVQVDAEGRVGIFLNGFDTPSDVDNGVPRSYGPDIHLMRTYVSPAIYAGGASSQCLHMACTLTLGTVYFWPAAAQQAGAGGQIGWRGTFRRADNADFRPGVKELVVLVGMWESRNVGDPGFDGNDTTPNITAGEHWVAGTLANGKSSHFVENYGASMMTGTAQNRTATFYWNISRANMLNILNTFGVTGTTPEEMRLVGTTISGELYDNRPDAQRTVFKPGQFGFSMTNPIVSIW